MPDRALSGWRDARVLVTGARGFIASRLCHHLAELGAMVHGTTSQVDFTIPAGSDITLHTVDLSKLDDVRSCFRRINPDVVFHLASHVIGSLGVEHVEPTFVANLASSVHVLTAASDHHTRRLVLAGSIREPADDESSPTPCSPYAAAKWAATGYARMFHALWRLPVVIARPTMVYGPGQWDLGKVLPYTITRLLRDESPVVGTGTQPFDWVYVDDVVSGLLALATSNIHGHAVDIGSGEIVTLREVLNHAASLIESRGSIRFGSRDERAFDTMRAARVDETRELIGWSATTRLIDGLRLTVDWYRNRWYSPTQD